MATQPEDDEPLELTEELDPDESEEQPVEPGPDDEGEEEPASVVFEGEEPEPESDNSVIRQMRQELRETKQKLREAETRSAPAKVEIGAKPTMESCGFDEEEFETALDAWKERKAAADRHEASQAEQNRQVNDAWQQDLTAFEQKKGRLAFEDRDEAIEGVSASLDLVQQAVIVKAADDPALFLYALSKSPAKLAELAKISDPVKMAASVARMEGAVKLVKGRKAPAPDRPANGSTALPGGSDKQLEKLEAEAERTGDRTKVINFKRAQRAKDA